ncbi:MAG: hypothetical protein IPJ37_14390 [Bacteroidales bacterium]|nr:hypothetical protein [Bacteroidales bacterium]
MIVLLICIQQRGFAQDTLSVIKPQKQHFKAEPLKATMLAVALPGAGQIYNRKFWKIPVVYAGFGALFYTAGFNGKNYTTYMKAYQDFTDAIPQTDSYLKLIPDNPEDYDPVLHPDTYDPSSASYYQDGLLRMVDYYKRYRDLSYIGIAAWYLISILDANVDASLFDFDVTDNLDLSLAPVLMPLPGGYTGAGLSASIRLTF